eukprot:4486182-Pyramimonas_sp.AAC.1
MPYVDHCTCALRDALCFTSVNSESGPYGVSSDHPIYYRAGGGAGAGAGGGGGAAQAGGRAGPRAGPPCGEAPKTGGAAQA